MNMTLTLNLTEYCMLRHITYLYSVVYSISMYKYTYTHTYKNTQHYTGMLYGIAYSTIIITNKYTLHSRS